MMRASASLLSVKAKAVYDEYGAYILVVDRYSRLMDNQDEVGAADPDFVASLRGSDLYEAFLKVLQGEEIAVRTQVGEKSTFTVGVPYIQDGRVLGAVLLQTPATSMESGLADWLLPLLAAGAAAVAAATLLIFLYVRRVLKPLGAVTEAARQMTSGDFTARVSETGPSPEIGELASAFNTMADKLSDV